MRALILVILFSVIFFIFPKNSYASLNVKETVLSNGLKILTSIREDSELVSINIYVRAGSRNERKNEEGISHFLEHLFFRGTNNSSGSEFKTELESLGGVANAETSKDYTRYYTNVPAKNAQKALKMLIDALQNASFNESEINQERSVVLEEYSLYKDSPARIFYDEIFKTAFPEHPYSKPVIGTQDNIKNFKRSDFLNYRERFYSPSNLVFVIIGNFDEKSALNTIKNAYSSKLNVSYDAPKNESKLLEKQEKKVIKKGAVRALLLGYYAPKVSDYNEIYALDVTCFLLGIGDGSYLKKHIVEKDKNIEAIDINFQTMKDRSLIIIAVVYKNKKPDEIIEKVSHVISDIGNGNFIEADLTRAKNMLINSFIFGNETNSGTAESIGYYEVIDSFKFAKNYTSNIEKVTKQNVEKIARELFKEPICILSIEPDKKHKKDEEDDD